MWIFDGQVENQGDIIERSAQELNAIAVIAITGGVGMAIPIPEDISNLDDPDFREQTMLILEVTTGDGTLHRMLFPEAAVQALHQHVGEYMTIKMHDMIQDDEVPPDIKGVMELLMQLREDLNDDNS